MNGSKPGRKQAPKKALIWTWLTCLTHWLYHVFEQSSLGRAMVSYRKADALFHHGRRRTLRDDCRPMSARRLRLLEMVRAGWLMKIIAFPFYVAAHCSARFYGLFNLFYGITCVLAQFIKNARTGAFFSRPTAFILPCVIALCGLPLLITKSSIARLLVQSRFTRWLFVGLLGLPEERVSRPVKWRNSQELQVLVPYFAFLFGTVAGILTIWIHPLVIPLGFLFLCAMAMVFSYPETGVILSVTTLPFVMMDDRALWITAGLILVTWIGYGIQLLFMHRSISFDLLDVAFLIFGGTLSLAGMTGLFVTSASLAEGVLILVLLSLYCLVTNLITSREQIRRCLVGPALSVGFVILTALLHLVPASPWDWLGGSIAGDFLMKYLNVIHNTVAGTAGDVHLSVLVMAIPLIFSMLWNSRRMGGAIFTLVMMVLGFAGLAIYESYLAIFSALLAVLLFFLLKDHKNLALSMLMLPVLLLGGVWVYHSYEKSFARLVERFTLGYAYRDQVWQSVWQAVCDYPAGIGLGDKAFVSVYPIYASPGLRDAANTSGFFMEILLRTGIPGFVSLMVFLFLVLQKAFTGLSVAERRGDASKLLGGMMSVVAFLIFGSASSATFTLPALLSLTVAIGICSAYENILFNEWDVANVSMTHSSSSVDLIIHPPGM